MPQQRCKQEMQGSRIAKRCGPRRQNPEAVCIESLSQLPLGSCPAGTSRDPGAHKRLREARSGTREIPGLENPCIAYGRRQDLHKQTRPGSPTFYCRQCRRHDYPIFGLLTLLGYRGTSLIRNSAPLGPYSRTLPRALRWS